MTEGKENLLSSFGECHRYAPKPLILERQTARDAQLVWPKTRAVDVCGEWYYGGLRLKQPATPVEPEVAPAEPETPPSDIAVAAANDSTSPARPQRSAT
ncbi:MAG: hypothetical protein ACFCVA_05995 [Gammaproteobacteria bacterium]